MGLLSKSRIEPLYAFREIDWENSKAIVIAQIRIAFNGAKIVIRSSALNEDTVECSNAGAFRSILNVDSSDELAIGSAIESVIASYAEKDAKNPNNPVLIQTQTLNVISSGVILTRDYNGAPYYVVNFSEGSDTSAVTSGNRRSRSIKLLRSQNRSSKHPFDGLIEAVKEIEGLVPSGMPLEVEYAITSNGEIVTFQVRPLTAVRASVEDTTILSRIDELRNNFRDLVKRQLHLAGDTTYFGDMPDWNPAEIIGNSPRLLAASLYDEIITGSVWHRARLSQGYINVDPAKLVIQFGNKPYVDMRNSFNSFVPAGISQELREKLLGYYLEKVRKNPQLQDKVEFEVLHTCYDFSFSKRAEELLGHGFSPAEVDELRQALINLTNTLLDPVALSADLRQNEELEQYRKGITPLPKNASVSEMTNLALEILEQCRERGTLQFSRLARLAFIAKILLKSLFREGIIDEDAYHGFLASISTVTSEFTRDINLIHHGKLELNDFLKKYGHLRPGTYDIRVPRYDMTDHYLSSSGFTMEGVSTEEGPFKLSPHMEARITEALRTHGLNIDANQLFEISKSAIEAREYSKFIFSKALSDAIELIATAGEKIGFTREDLSNLDVTSIKSASENDDSAIQNNWSEIISTNRKKYELDGHINLPPVIFSEQDFEIISPYDSRPNYITNKKAQGEVIILDNNNHADVTGKVVIIEAADPGYDWIFAKKPAALITKYGGPASHMSVRCAELGLPAMIGVGEHVYESLLRAEYLTLDCENQIFTFDEATK